MVNPLYAVLTYAIMSPVVGEVMYDVEQVHLAFGNEPGVLNVAWVTPNGTVATLYYGLYGGPLKETSSCDTRQLNVSGNRYTHEAVMTGLHEDTKYSYRVGQTGTLFNVTYSREHNPLKVQKHIIFGDMGTSHAFSICDACNGTSQVCTAQTCAKNTSVGLVSELDANVMVHTGDYAYNFDTDGGNYGDQFMRNIEQIAAQVPYMTVPGNHENSVTNQAHYVERFRNQPTNADPPTYDTLAGTGKNNMYFSFNVGLVHYISFSTEFWFGVGNSKVNKETAVAWLKKDLAAANANRANVPWIIAFGHRSLLCTDSDGDDCFVEAWELRQALQEIFFDSGVDFWINGHEHNYERSYPTYDLKSVKSYVDPKANIYIVTGAAGSPEMHEPFTKTPPSWSAYRSNTFGYNRLYIHNNTHVRIQYVQTDPTLFPLADYGRVIDDFWVIQHNHGPFNKELAPKGKAWPRGDDNVTRTLDHWEPLLRIPKPPPGLGVATAIANFRKDHGEEAWAKQEDLILRTVNLDLGKAEWEDVREDGSSDGAWFVWKGRDSA
eukprot:m.21302 g.21302  ORF g.21302 m.21302 type:complete len:548 (+) comp7102_c0_seq1:140-1783(+)